jgi:hypothetical protein
MNSLNLPPTVQIALGGGFVLFIFVAMEIDYFSLHVYLLWLPSDKCNLFA